MTGREPPLTLSEQELLRISRRVGIEGAIDRLLNVERPARSSVIEPDVIIDDDGREIRKNGPRPGSRKA
jgi:hypothetical protein